VTRTEYAATPNWRRGPPTGQWSTAGSGSPSLHIATAKWTTSRCTMGKTWHPPLTSLASSEAGRDTVTMTYSTATYGTRSDMIVDDGVAPVGGRLDLENVAELPYGVALACDARRARAT